MSKLKIFTNAVGEIHALRYTEDTSLTCYEIDREAVFGVVSDAVILGYRYEPQTDENGNPATPIVTPYLDLNQLHAVDAGIQQVMQEASNIIYVNQVSVEELIKFHKKAINRVMQKIIYTGIDLGGKHYSLSDDDQRNINRWVTKLELHPEISYVPYHADGENCGMITRDIMLAIGNLAEALVFFHTTRVNRLHRMIEACTRKRDVLAIQYDTPLTTELQREVDELYLKMQIRGEVRDYLNSTIYTGGETEGEIYTNAGSMIDLPTYVTVDDWCTLGEFQYEKLPGNDNTLYRYTLPIKLIDDDKIPLPGYGQKAPEFALSAVFHEMVIADDNKISLGEEYTTAYTTMYRRNPRSGAPELYMDIHNNVCLKVTIPLACITNTTDERVNPELSFYIINNQNGHKITDSEFEVACCMGMMAEPEVPQYDENGVLLNPIPIQETL
ncbi:MAG: hypothetical protein NC548_27840 [Lachnospiraceae bacterium]|nr:hypothetical protein [Lachnospiraceae bacterium]